MHGIFFSKLKAASGKSKAAPSFLFEFQKHFLRSVLLHNQSPCKNTSEVEGIVLNKL